jgi:4-aminobutyrate aminotransferase-like enzyme
VQAVSLPLKQCVGQTVSLPQQIDSLSYLWRNKMQIFEQVESQVRSYIRAFPTVFEKSKGAMLYDEQGKVYIDFFAGAGTLNYGHNNDAITTAMIDYLQNDGVVHALDMGTTAKKRFLETFTTSILAPRNFNYKIQFVPMSRLCHLMAIWGRM